MKTVYFILMAFILQQNVSAQWYYSQPMPDARSGLSAVTLDSMIYIIGGSRNGNNGIIDVDAFDPVSESWIPGTTNLNFARTNAAAVVHNNFIYVFGGRDQNNMVTKTEIFDAITNTWTVVGDMPTPRAGFNALVIDNKIWLIGGIAFSQETFNIVEIYDPLTAEWDTLGYKLNFGRVAPVSATINGDIYVFGGFFHGPLNSFEKFIPGSGWQIQGNMLYGCGSSDAVMSGNEIIIAGGQGFSGNLMNNVQAFKDGQFNTWYDKPALNTSRKDLALAAWNNKIFSFGGNVSVQHQIPSDVVEVLDMTTGFIHKDENILQEENLFLSQNYPNPFNSSTKFSIFTAIPEYVDVGLYNIAGQKIITLFKGHNQGWSVFQFSGDDMRENTLPSGLYFIRIRTKTDERSIKILYAK